MAPILPAWQNPTYSLKKLSDGKWIIGKNKLDLKDLSDVQICRLMTITSKKIINLGEADDFVAKPVDANPDRAAAKSGRFSRG